MKREQIEVLKTLDFCLIKIALADFVEKSSWNSLKMTARDNIEKIEFLQGFIDYKSWEGDK